MKALPKPYHLLKARNPAHARRKRPEKRGRIIRGESFVGVRTRCTGLASMHTDVKRMIINRLQPQLPGTDSFNRCLFQIHSKSQCQSQCRSHCQSLSPERHLIFRFFLRWIGHRLLSFVLANGDVTERSDDDDIIYPSSGIDSQEGSLLDVHPSMTANSISLCFTPRDLDEDLSYEGEIAKVHSRISRSDAASATASVIPDYPMNRKYRQPPTLRCRKLLFQIDLPCYYTR